MKRLVLLSLLTACGPTYIDVHDNTITGEAQVSVAEESAEVSIEKANPPPVAPKPVIVTAKPVVVASAPVPVLPTPEIIKAPTEVIEAPVEPVVVVIKEEPTPPIIAPPDSTPIIVPVTVTARFECKYTKKGNHVFKAFLEDLSDGSTRYTVNVENFHARAIQDFVWLETPERVAMRHSEIFSSTGQAYTQTTEYLTEMNGQFATPLHIGTEPWTGMWSLIGTEIEGVGRTVSIRSTHNTDPAVSERIVCPAAQI